MFGHWYRDESPFGVGETTTLWAAIPSIPMSERGSRKLEGRKQQKGVVIHYSRLMIDADCVGTEPGL